MFTAVCMTLCTVTAVVAALLLVFIIHFVLLMAIGAGPAGGVATGMACPTIVVCATVPCGERMVEGCPRKRIRVVTVRTLPGIVIRRRCMAGGTVS